MQLVLPPFTAAAIRVYDEARNVIETHEHEGDFKRDEFLLRIIIKHNGRSGPDFSIIAGFHILSRL
jgi:hypothetical protein